MISQDKITSIAAELVRENGFMSANQLIAALFAWYSDSTDKGKIDTNMFMISLSDVTKFDDIHAVEYANSSTSSFRRKDLYYFNPSGPK